MSAKFNEITAASAKFNEITAVSAKFNEIMSVGAKFKQNTANFTKEYWNSRNCIVRPNLSGN